MTHIDTELVKACSLNGQRITKIRHEGEAVSGPRLLLTITGLESAFGARRQFVRMEPAYAPGGRYYQESDVVRKYWWTYGCLGASSYGSFQVMFVTARELGYTGPPIDLQQDDTCAYWATQLITERLIKRQGATTLSEVLDGYNSGNAKDRNIPAAYVRRGLLIYAELGAI